MEIKIEKEESSQVENFNLKQEIIAQRFKILEYEQKMLKKDYDNFIFNICLKNNVDINNKNIFIEDNKIIIEEIKK
jgi:hypothetical protein